MAPSTAHVAPGARRTTPRPTRAAHHVTGGASRRVTPVTLGASAVALAVATVALAGCTRSPAELRVIVYSDLQAGTELRAVRLRTCAAGEPCAEPGAACGPGASTCATVPVVAAGENGVHVPFSFGIVTHGTLPYRVRLEVEALADDGGTDGAPLVALAVQVTIPKSGARTVPIRLSRRCAGQAWVACSDAGETCVEGRCTAVDEAEDLLADLPDDLPPEEGCRCAADLDANGAVGQADLARLEACLKTGSDADCAGADVDCDGSVTACDAGRIHCRALGGDEACCEEPCGACAHDGGKACSETTAGYCEAETVELDGEKLEGLLGAFEGAGTLCDGDSPERTAPACTCELDVTGDGAIANDDAALVETCLGALPGLACPTGDASCPGADGLCGRADLDCDGAVTRCDLARAKDALALPAEARPSPCELPCGACVVAGLVGCFETTSADCSARVGATYSGDGSRCRTDEACECSADASRSGALTDCGDDLAVTRACAQRPPSGPCLGADIDCSGAIDDCDAGRAWVTAHGQLGERRFACNDDLCVLCQLRTADGTMTAGCGPSTPSYCTRPGGRGSVLAAGEACPFTALCTCATNVDASADGATTSADAAATVACATAGAPAGGCDAVAAARRADIDCDGVVDACDAGRVRAAAAGLPEGLASACQIPCGACVHPTDPRSCLLSTRAECAREGRTSWTYVGDGTRCFEGLACALMGDVDGDGAAGSADLAACDADPSRHGCELADINHSGAIDAVDRDWYACLEAMGNDIDECCESVVVLGQCPLGHLTGTVDAEPLEP